MAHPPYKWDTGEPNPEAETWKARRWGCLLGLLFLAVTALAGCRLTASVTARPVIDGVPVNIGVGWEGPGGP